MSCSPTGSYIPLTGLLFVLRQNVVYLRIFRLPTLPHLGIFIKIITAIRRYVIGAYPFKPYRLITAMRLVLFLHIATIIWLVLFY